jgi:phage baseplate assembly protein W
MTPTPVFSGLDAKTGHRISGEAHLLASVRDVLTTPIGSRVLAREYGSMLPDLLDAPAGPSLFAEIRAAVGDALTRWEPRLKLSRVQVIASEAGQLDVTLDGWFEGRALTLNGVLS